jgi:rare lipoprotein A
MAILEVHYTNYIMFKQLLIGTTILATAATTLLPVAPAEAGRVRRQGGQSGLASFYGYEGGTRTANGERYNPGSLTAAHRTLPFGTRVRVTNASNGRSVVVRINNRGPFIGGRVIDLSTAAASRIGLTSRGVGQVNIQVLGR